MGVKKATDSRGKPSQRLNQSLLGFTDIRNNKQKLRISRLILSFVILAKIGTIYYMLLTSDGGAGDGRRDSINRQLNSTESIRTLSLGLYQEPLCIKII